eukprot:6200974-Pleurochrysis_carterae.AAC.2
MAPLACEYEFATAADVQPEVLHLGGNTPGWIEATPELHRAVGASDSNALKAALKGKVPANHALNGCIACGIPNRSRTVLAVLFLFLA